MSEPTDAAMAADIEAAVREVPGVTALFRTEGIVARLAGAGARLLRASQPAPPLIDWERSEDGPRAEAAIGVGVAAGAAETIDRVRAAIAALCADRGCPRAEIRITVVRVDDDLTGEA